MPLGNPIKPLLWAELTWEQLRDMRAEGVDMVIFPVGSTEQHGPHLSVNVDTFCAELVAHAVSARTAVPVLPVLPYGCAMGHTRRWPGTLSLSPGTLSLVVRELLEDVIAYGFTRILILSGHVTNHAPLRCALEELRNAHPDLQIAQKHLMDVSDRVLQAYTSDATDWHANAAETALMMHLAPHLVRTERIVDDPDRTPDLVFSYTVPATSLYGHTGSPSRATPQMGEELFEALVRDWTFVVKKAMIEKPPICGPPPGGAQDAVSRPVPPLQDLAASGDPPVRRMTAPHAAAGRVFDGVSQQANAESSPNGLFRAPSGAS